MYFRDENDLPGPGYGSQHQPAEKTLREYDPVRATTEEEMELS